MMCKHSPKPTPADRSMMSTPPSLPGAKTEPSALPHHMTPHDGRVQPSPSAPAQGRTPPSMYMPMHLPVGMRPPAMQHSLPFPNHAAFLQQHHQFAAPSQYGMYSPPPMNPFDLAYANAQAFHAMNVSRFAAAAISLQQPPLGPTVSACSTCHHPSHLAYEWPLAGEKPQREPSPSASPPVPAYQSSHPSTPTAITDAAGQAGSQDYHQVWFCDTCLLGYRVQSKYDAHLKKHKPCCIPGCAFVGIKRVVKVHIQNVHPEVADNLEVIKAFGSKSEKKRANAEFLRIKQVLTEWEALTASRSALQSPPPNPPSSQTHPEHNTWEASRSTGSSTGSEPLQLSAGASEERVDGGAAATAWEPSGPSADSYRCDMCGASGHSIYDCELYMKENKAKKEKKSTLQFPFRCEPCDKGFTRASLMQVHTERHIVCLEPGCDFSAAKCVVEAHMAAAHAHMERHNQGAQAQPFESGRSDESTSEGAKVMSGWGEVGEAEFHASLQQDEHFENEAVRGIPTDSNSSSSESSSPHSPSRSTSGDSVAGLSPSGSASGDAFQDRTSASSTFTGVPTVNRSAPLHPLEEDKPSVDSPRDQAQMDPQTFTSVPQSSVEVDLKTHEDEMRALTGNLTVDLEGSAAPAAPSPSKKSRTWYCVTCDEEFSVAESKVHMSSHVSCLAPDCQFTASKEIVLQHVLSAHGQNQVKNEPRRSTSRTTRASQDTQVWRCDDSLPAQTQTSPPSSYCCKICSAPGHWIANCPQYVKSVDTVARPPVLLQQQERQPLQVLPWQSSWASGGSSVFSDSSGSESWASVDGSVKSTEKPARFWRCETCNKDLVLESQLQAHFAQHVVCPEPTCSFSASKRVVTEHVAATHGSAAPVPAATLTPRTKPSEIPAWYRCKICGIPGHLIYDCAQYVTAEHSSASQVASGPPAEYCCKICKVPGHWIVACPKYIKPKSNATDAQPLAVSKTTSAAVPAQYCCKICKLPGHLIYNCPRHIKGYNAAKESEAAENDNAVKEGGKTTENSKVENKKPFRCEPCDKDMALESQLQMHIKQHEVCPEPGYELFAAKRVATQHLAAAHGKLRQPNQGTEVLSLDGKPDDSTEAKANFGRCEVCDIDFKAMHTPALHFSQHVSCPEPGCEFSASKRILMAHVKCAHRQEETSLNRSSAILPDTTNQEVVVQGRKYRLQEIEVGGLKCMVLVDVATGSISSE